jgi:uncharacterized protein (DUF1501 family)
MSGGNDGLNTVVPHADDNYYRLRPTLGIRQSSLLALDDQFGFNPGLQGLQKLWRNDQLALIHGCGYDNPIFSHFNAMAYWHTGAPHQGNEFGWLGRVADQMVGQRRDDMLVHVGTSQSLAVKSAVHTPVVFDDPMRFQRSGSGLMIDPSPAPDLVRSNRDFLLAVDASARASSARIKQAWSDYRPQADYGVVPMDLPKVAACIKAGLQTQLYHVAVRNNAFDTHVQQAALHRRLLSYVSDAVHGFLTDLKAMGHDQRVIVMLHSEFGRRPKENANLGTDHGSANLMMVAGTPVSGGHYGGTPSLDGLGEGDNLHFTTDFRRVYGTIVSDWLGVPADRVLSGDHRSLGFLA